MAFRVLTQGGKVKKLERLVFPVGDAVVTMTNVDLKDPKVMKILVDNGVWEDGGIPLQKILHISAMQPPEPTADSGFSSNDRELLRILRLSLNDPECNLSRHTERVLTSREIDGRLDPIDNIWNLVQREEADVCRTPGFGKKSRADVRSVLDRFKLTFGMDISRFEPYIDGY